jgi:hypothetical protein
VKTSIILSIAIAALAGCSASKSGDDNGGLGGGDTGTQFNLDGGGGDTNDLHPDGNVGGDGGDGCTDAAKLIYVVTVEGDLYSFDPPTLTLKKIGPLTCPSSSSPNSMAVDRNAVAYVNYSDGSIFRVSTKDASCTTTSWTPTSFLTMGMGFSVNTPGGTAETLFVADQTGGGLSKIDVSTFNLTSIGPFGAPHVGGQPELTGTGDALLYAFFPQAPSAISKIDKATAAVVQDYPLPGMPTDTQAWAFSFWGGVFYLYTSPCSTPGACTTNTTIRKYDPSTKALTIEKPDIGFNIDGAGVSTCAPVVPVK